MPKFELLFALQAGAVSKCGDARRKDGYLRSRDSVCISHAAQLRAEVLRAARQGLLDQGQKREPLLEGDGQKIKH